MIGRLLLASLLAVGAAELRPLVQPTVTVTASPYCAGWSAGWKRGWQEVRGRGYPPYPPYCPYPSYPARADSYQDGYDAGFLAGIEAAS